MTTGAANYLQGWKLQGHHFIKFAPGSLQGPCNLCGKGEENDVQLVFHEIFPSDALTIYRSVPQPTLQTLGQYAKSSLAVANN